MSDDSPNMKALTHWRQAFDREYLAFGDLDGVDVVVVIEKYGSRKSPMDGKSKGVLAFVGAKKKLMCGPGVCKTIAGIYGSNPAGWIGKPITLYEDPEVMFGREKTGGIRVRPVAPAKAKP